MKCRGKFKFKEITKRESGTFINAQGQQINYDESYALKVDEKTERGIQERVFKVAKDSSLIPELKKMTEYTDIILDFDVVFFGSIIRIIPVEIVKK